MERKEAIEIVKSNLPDSSFTMLREALEALIPELQNEDERIKKTLIRLFTSENVAEQYYGITCKQIIAWINKQGKEQTKVSIWKHWKDGFTGNGEGKLIYLVKTNNTYELTSCLSLECDYIELSELDNLMIEK